MKYEHSSKISNTYKLISICTIICYHLSVIFFWKAETKMKIVETCAYCAIEKVSAYAQYISLNVGRFIPFSGNTDQKQNSISILCLQQDVL